MSIRVYVCHSCHGRFEGDDGTGRPWGWYALTVNVPRGMGKKDQPFLWVGLWCSAACLAADMPELEDQERLARLAYEADLPELRQRVTSQLVRSPVAYAAFVRDGRHGYRIHLT